MVSFELGKEVKKDGFLSCLECGTKTQTFGFCASVNRMLITSNLLSSISC